MNNLWQVDSEHVNERLNGLFESELYSDFTFIITDDNVRIPAHKIIISAASVVFERIACGSDYFQSNDTAEVDGISSSAFREILRYIYTDDLNLNKDNVIEILRKSNYYCLAHLEAICKEYLSNTLSASTVCWIYHKILHESFCEDLMEKCITLIAENPIDFFRSEEFVKYSIPEVTEILKLDQIKCIELHIFRYIVKWGRENLKHLDMEETIENWKDILDGAHQMIRFTTMKMSHFDECVSTLPGFWSIDEIEDIKQCIRNGTPRQRSRFYLFKDNGIVSTWRKLNPNMPTLPANSVSCGVLNDQRLEMFLGKLKHNGVYEACQIDFGDIASMSSFDSEEDFISAERLDLQILYGSGFEWIGYNADDGIPLGAVTTDILEDSPILIGRVFVENVWHVVPVFCRNNQLSMTINEQLIMSDFAILVSQYRPEFYIGNEEPLDAVVIGKNENDMNVYLGMGFTSNVQLVPASIIPDMRIALATPTTERQPPIIIQKGNYNFLQMHPATISWTRLSFDDEIPSNAIVAGLSSPFGENFYYGRSRHNNITVAGTIYSGIFYYVYNNEVNSKSVYEILTKIPFE